ncbi:axin-related protein-like [Spea bombifrons]|uniref:axin-related protein-like n=1 Tax=Spea bombifrons TaxID=233779 RepID=UPI00234A0ED6|nr:axin-related protein-like [Spea bombifrons]
MSSAGVLTCMPDSGQIFRETSLRPPVPGQETKHFKTEKYTMEPQQPRYKEDVLREAEGCVSHDTRFSRWGRSLNGLLDDQDGATLFRMYLEGEGLVDLLSFWFACNGFRAMDLAEPKTLKTAKAIYRWYVQNSQAVSSRLKPATRAQVKDCVKNQQLNRTLFDQAQQEIQKAMEQEAFPSFLQSDICKEYSHVEDSPTPDSPRLGLPTLTEDEEFGVHHGPVNAGAVGKINRAFTRIPPRHQRFHTRKAEAAYQYFAPAASINDSEISSDALTEDSMSMTDGSVDGIPPYRSKKQREIHRSVSANGQVHLPFVPRTLRPPAEMMPSNPAEFAAKLTIALERVKKQREAEERLEERLQRLKEEEEKVEYDIPSSGQEPFATSAEDDPQSILDDHVSRVLKTPANLSPRAQSPFTQRKAKGQSAFAKCQSSTSSHIRPKVSQGMESVVPASVEHKSANSSQGTRSYRKTEGCAQSYRVEEGSSSVPLTTPLSPEQEVERTHSVLQWVLESAKLMKKHHRDGSTTVNHCPEMKKSTHRTASQPAHLFLQDTSMPPLTAPNTLDQLEEARRRLVEEKRLPKVHKARCAPSSTLKEKGKTTESVPSSGFSTLKLSEEHKAAKKLNSDGQGQGGLAIVYYFCGERIPYMIRTKEPSLTLQEFKELLSKKGSYKYYFKKESHEFECNAVFQEVSEEDAVLPLYEEKIICKVERAC